MSHSNNTHMPLTKVVRFLSHFLALNQEMRCFLDYETFVPAVSLHGKRLRFTTEVCNDLEECYGKSTKELVRLMYEHLFVAGEPKLTVYMGWRGRNSDKFGEYDGNIYLDPADSKSDWLAKCSFDGVEDWDEPCDRCNGDEYYQPCEKCGTGVTHD